MYSPRGQFGVAKARYQSVDLSSRVEGASPHELVMILFDELLKALDAMAAAAERKDFVQRGQRQSRALSILLGLESSLDFSQGGDLARDLALVYREGRRLIIAGGRDDETKIVKAREMLGEIASAWGQIGRG
jgi:flagellar secretion chaperone FliS